MAFLFSCSDYLIKGYETMGPELVVYPEIHNNSLQNIHLLVVQGI